MPGSRKQLKKEMALAIHLMAWLILTYVFSQVFRIEFKTIHVVNGRLSESITAHTFLGFVIISLAFKAVFFYINVFYRPAFLFGGGKSLFALFHSLALIILVGLELLVIFIAVEFFQMSRPPWLLFLWPEVLLWAVALTIALTWSKIREWEKAEQLSKKIAEEHLKTELNFLKAQISPHFFLNTLNNLYSMAQARDINELEDGLLQLSEMMRYMLYDCQADAVSIEREMECIRSYIGLTLLRYRQDGNIKVTFDADEAGLAGFSIAPVILVPFVENAFKHGIASGKSSVIDIKLFVKNSQLMFKVKNTDHSNHQQHFEKNGIGVNNVKRRLDMIYPGKYELEISKESGVYTILLKLNENEMRYH